MTAREDAVAALRRAETQAARGNEAAAAVTALTGIGYALLHLADTIQEGQGKYDPPF